MTLRLFDTATRQVRDFQPRVPGQVGMYVCGATVQAAPHIGHMRSAVAFDVLVRWLRRTGLNVTYIRNVTDIDDKILTKSEAAGQAWWAWAALHERKFTDAYDALGNLLPTYEPRATGHMTDMIELMDRLVERGHAYQVGEGNVYFDTRSWDAYGQLTNQQIEDALPHEDTDEETRKRDARDFALWKAAKAGEPETARWNTPYGPGRPGWHLECSAMAKRYLGEAFDIHGGGLDLRFPHHENEQAQSKAAGYEFANYWMHSAWVTQGGTKMSKSLGNGLLVSEVLKAAPAVALRYALATVHYRSMLEWTMASDEAPVGTLEEAVAAWERFEGFYARATEKVGEIPADEVAQAALPQAFIDAMNDDLNVSVGLASVHEHLKAGNSALASGDLGAVREHLLVFRAMLDVFGLDPAAWQQASGDDRERKALDVLVAAHIENRAQARKDRDFATADSIRDTLAEAGIVVEDSASGARWSLG